MFKSSLNRCVNYTLFKGNKDSFVFIHGLGSSQNSFYSIAKELNKDGHNCLIFDNYGAALSPFSGGVASLDKTLVDITELINHLQLKNIILVGHSMGGMIVNYLSLNANIDLKKIVLLAPVHPASAMKQVFDERIDLVNKSKDLSILYNSIPEAAVGSKTNGLVKSFIRELISRQDYKGYIHNCELISNSTSLESYFAENYKEIKVPVLAIIGDEDKTTPVSITGIITSSLAQVKVVTFNVGHWIAVENPEGTLEEIRAFTST